MHHARRLTLTVLLVLKLRTAPDSFFAVQMDSVQDPPLSPGSIKVAFGGSPLYFGSDDDVLEEAPTDLSPETWRVGKRKRSKCDDGMQYPDVPYEPKVISKQPAFFSAPAMDNINVRLVVASLGGSDHGLNVEAVSRLRDKTREMTRVESDRVGVPVGNYVYVKVLRDVTTKAEYTELMESLHVDFQAGGYRQFLPKHTFGNLSSRKTLGGGLKVGKAGSRVYFSL